MAILAGHQWAYHSTSGCRWQCSRWRYHECPRAYFATAALAGSEYLADSRPVCGLNRRRQRLQPSRTAWNSPTLKATVAEALLCRPDLDSTRLIERIPNAF